MKVLNKTTGGALVAALLSITTSDLMASAANSDQMNPEYPTSSSFTPVATAAVMVKPNYRADFMGGEMESYKPTALNLGAYTGSTARSSRSSDESHIQSVLSSLYGDQEAVAKFSSQFSLKVEKAYSLSTSKQLEEMISATDVSEQHLVAYKQAINPPLTVNLDQFKLYQPKYVLKSGTTDSQQQKDSTCCGGCSIQ